MESTENMQDFNIPFIEQDAPPPSADLTSSTADNASFPSDENRFEPAPVGQETDNEALSSLLMLSKSNADQGSKQFTGETNGNAVDNDQNKIPTAVKVIVKRALPSTERSVRGDTQPLSKSVKMEDLRKFFHLPIVEVARQLGTCTTALKKICRKNKINKWPYRQIRSITKSIQSLEMASLNDTLPEDLRIQYRQQIVTLQNAIDELIKDPNGVIQLVNMGLSEEALMHLRESNAVSMAAAGSNDDDFDGPITSTSLTGGALHSHEAAHTHHAHHIPHSSHNTLSAGMNNNGSKAGGYAVTTHNNGGAQGVLNLLQWPKPSADVQQIMQAAAQLTTQSDHLAASRRTSSQKAKRKSSEAGLDNPDEHTANIDGDTAGEKHTEGVLDLSQLEGGNLRHKKVEIGDTVADCVFVAESQRMVFSGPVHLAPLQRKKLKPNITRKVVPLMEPDIGSNFGIEFIPQFILNILHSAIGSSNMINEGHRQQLMQQQQQAQVQQQQAQAQAQHLAQQQVLMQQQQQAQQLQQRMYQGDAAATIHASHSNNSINNNNSIDAASIDESIHNYINDNASYTPSPVVYNNSGSGGGNNSDGGVYSGSSASVGVDTRNIHTSSSYAYSQNTDTTTVSNSSSVYPSTAHYTLEPSASQAAAHLVSLNNS